MVFARYAGSGSKSVSAEQAYALAASVLFFEDECLIGIKLDPDFFSQSEGRCIRMPQLNMGVRLRPFAKTEADQARIAGILDAAN